MNYDIQEVFDLLIDHEIYNPHSPNLGFMCDAVDYADKIELIPSKVAVKIKKRIATYTKGYFTLRGILTLNGLPNEPDDLLKIYQDWENRPDLSNDLDRALLHYDC